MGEVKQRSPHWLMKKAIGEFLDAEERYEREKAEDHARWERYLETDAYVTHDEMAVRLEELATIAEAKAASE